MRYLRGSSRAQRRDGTHHGRSRIVVGVAVAATIAGGSVGASPVAAGSADGNRANDISWGPVKTLWDQSPDNVTTLTTDSGMAVAVWTGQGFRNLWVAVRPAHQQWSEPTKVQTTAAALTLVKDGKQAWLVWQGFTSVSVLPIAPDGTLGSREVIGSSSDPFQSSPIVAVGTHGEMAATWYHHNPRPYFAYRGQDGVWTDPESLPFEGSVDGLVVGAAGVAQIVMSTDEGLIYARRTMAGGWSKPFVISAHASLATVAANRHGDIAVGWQVVNDDHTVSLAARYKAAESPFDESHQLSQDVPGGTSMGLAIAADGALATAYQITSQGAQQIQMTPADPTGAWLDPQVLTMQGSAKVAMNSAGDFVVTSQSDGALQLVTCTSAFTCGDTQVNKAPRYKRVDTSIGPGGTITLVWGRGCHTEECLPTSLVAQRGR